MRDPVCGRARRPPGARINVDYANTEFADLEENPGRKIMHRMINF
jgi:hypothetical protein